MLAWLDTSADEQRRVRELIALFAQAESRDELGIGQIRDAFSELLFPGTSVIQTRARYLLFVPWIYRDGSTRGRRGPQLKAWADVKERKLIETLRAAGAVRGLIGRRAGPDLKILPSTIYWSGLVRYGILRGDVGPDQLGDTGTSTALQEADELAGRNVGDWHPTLPHPPAGFPDDVGTGFELTRPEAHWLQERIITAVPDTLLAHLVQRDGPPNPGSPAPWLDAACADAPDANRDQLEHARLFSIGMYGAALLYNLLVAERYEAARHTRIEEPVAGYRDRLGEWAQLCADAGHQLAAWDRPQMWRIIHDVNRRISPVTRSFVDTWLDAVVSAAINEVADSKPLRMLVAERERKHKKTQSRLTNERLLRTWSGEAGTAPLTYRWPVVRDIVIDIYEGALGDAGS